MTINDTYLCVQLPRGIIVPYVVCEVPLHAAELLVSFFRELALHANHGLEAWVEERYSEIEQLWKFGDELLVEHVEDLLRVVVFLLRLQCASETFVERGRVETYFW